MHAPTRGSIAIRHELTNPPGPPTLVPAAAPTASASAERLRLLLCAAVAALGSAVIAGWLLDVPALKSVAPGLSTMKFNTAVAFLLAGAALALAGKTRAIVRRTGAAIGILLFLLAAITGSQYLLGVDFGIDQAAVRDIGSLRGSGFPGRMSPLTSIAFSGLGIGTILLATATRRIEVIIAHCLAMVAGAVAVLAAAGYAFGAEAFWRVGPYTFIAVHTAVGLLVAAGAALMTRAREGWLAPYADSPAALGLLTRLLPVAFGLPTLIGLLVMLGAGLGAYNAPYALALFIPLASVAMMLSALWVARKQRDAEEIRMRYERHLHLVVAELNHRVKNTLSIVQSFAHQSLRSGSSPEEAGAAFEGRLTALASAHKVLTRENWDNVSLIELVTDALDPHNDTGTRFAIEGDDIAVSPKSAITLVMTLHELATNSTKYGALSAADGYVRIRWGIADGRFRLEWKDVDGPPCGDPARKGFGTRMLTRALAAELGGKAALHFERDGLRYEIEAPARGEL